MDFEPDITLLSPSQDPILIVEIDNHENLTEADARRHFEVLQFDPQAAKYFMVVSQDVAYWWPASEPNYVRRLPMTDILKRFIPDVASRGRLFGFQVEMLVHTWLSELAAGWRGAADFPESTLVSTGLLDDVRGATVYKPAAV